MHMHARTVAGSASVVGFVNPAILLSTCMNAYLEHNVATLAATFPGVTVGFYLGNDVHCATPRQVEAVPNQTKRVFATDADTLHRCAQRHGVSSGLRGRRLGSRWAHEHHCGCACRHRRHTASRMACSSDATARSTPPVLVGTETGQTHSLALTAHRHNPALVPMPATDAGRTQPTL